MEEIDIKERIHEANIAFLLDTYRLAPNLLDKEELEILRRKKLIDPKPGDDEYTSDRRELTGDEKEKDHGLDRAPLSIEQYLARIPQSMRDRWKNKEIKSRDWMCDFPDEFDDDFHSWICSTHDRFCDMIPYEKFYLYLEWNLRALEKNDRASDYMDEYAREKFYKVEVARIHKSSMYFADKYGFIKDAAIDSGEWRYKANLAHAFMMFLFDQGRSVWQGKGRQMASTSTMGMCAAKTLVSRPNSHQVFIAHDKESGETILEDKIKYPFGQLEDWLRPKVLNDPDGKFRVTFLPGGEKGVEKTKSSSIGTRTPAIDAINSRSPDVVFVDEAPFIGMFDAMYFEAKPTMRGFDPTTGRQRMKRQLWAWGTGGRTKMGGGVFERELRSLFEKWRKKDFSDGIVPLFLDWTCRPGVTVEDYKKEKHAYESGTLEGHTYLSLTERMIQFRQHWPSSLDDMFTTIKPTVIPWSMIMKGIEKVDRWESKGVRATYGRFDPIYNVNKPMAPGSIEPYEIIGANWIPSADGDITSPALMWQDRDQDYINRYRQGTDPIQHDAGQSRMASSIIDVEKGTISCIINHRSDNPHESYRQVALMGMYYAERAERFCPELIETNFMAGYRAYKCGPWLNGEKSFVRRYQLPIGLRGNQDGSNTIGVDTKSNRKPLIVGHLKDFLLDFRRALMLKPVWTQLKHFVAQPTKSDAGAKWGSEDPTQHQDDLVISTALAYICSLCFSNKPPMRIADYKKLVEARKTKRYVLDTSELTPSVRVVMA